MSKPLSKTEGSSLARGEKKQAAFKRLRRHSGPDAPDLNEAEARAARSILAEPNWVTQSSIKALAQKAQVSEPTVIRLCRKLELAGFKAFKPRLTEDLVLFDVY